MEKGLTPATSINSEIAIGPEIRLWCRRCVIGLSQQQNWQSALLPAAVQHTGSLGGTSGIQHIDHGQNPGRRQ